MQSARRNLPSCSRPRWRRSMAIRRGSGRKNAALVTTRRDSFLKAVWNMVRNPNLIVLRSRLGGPRSAPGGGCKRNETVQLHYLSVRYSIQPTLVPADIRGNSPHAGYETVDFARECAVPRAVVSARNVHPAGEPQHAVALVGSGRARHRTWSFSTGPESTAVNRVAPK